MKTKTVAWHRPQCSDCGEPIRSAGDAYACWLRIGERLDQPQVVHRGGGCGHAKRVIRRSLPRGAHLQDLSVEFFRRAPWNAVDLALRATASGGDVDAWSRWVMVVLGLPGGDALQLLATNATGDVIVERV